MHAGFGREFNDSISHAGSIYFRESLFFGTIFGVEVESVWKISVTLTCVSQTLRYKYIVNGNAREYIYIYIDSRMIVERS